MLINLLLIQQRISNLTRSILDLVRNTLSSSRSLLGHVGGDLALGRRGVDAVAAVLLDELSEVLDCAGTLVRDRGVLLAGCVQLDGGEALDLVWHVVEGCVDLGDGDLVGERLEELSQLVVLGGETVKKCISYCGSGE